MGLGLDTPVVPRYVDECVDELFHKVGDGQDVRSVQETLDGNEGSLSLSLSLSVCVCVCIYICVCVCVRVYPLLNQN